MRCVLFHPSAAVLALAAAWATVASATPTVVHSMMSQQPPVARVGSEFVFDLVAGSYASNSSSNSSTTAITYSATSLPSWLTFSPSVTTFYGTPQASDIGTFNVTLVATDATGSVRDTAVLIVSNSSAPTVQQSFASQIADASSRQFASATAMPDNTGVEVPPYWSFSLGWSGNTFKSSQKLYYTARLHDGTALPSWLEWSNTTFTFNGNAPANGTYPVVVTATDYWGYSGAETSFVLAVGNGQAVEVNSTNWKPLNTVTRGSVNYTIDTSGVTVGGQAATASQYTVTPDLSNYKWLSFDKSTNILTGVTPDAYLNGTIDPMAIPVNLASTNASNTLGYTAYVNMNIFQYYFTNFTLPSLTSSNGSTFEYNVGPYLVNKNVSVNATVVPSEAQSWLKYYYENYTLIGSIPGNVTYDNLNITFMATVQGVSATTSFYVNITGVDATNATTTPAPIPMAPIQHGLSKTKKIIIGVVVGVVGALLILLAFLLWFCCCRRSREERRIDEKVKIYEEASAMSNRTTLINSRRTSGRPPAFTPDTLKHSPAPKSIADSDATVYGTPSTPTSKLKPAVEEGTPRRLDFINGLFGPGDHYEDAEEGLASLRSVPDSGSFLGNGDVIAVADPVRRQRAGTGVTGSAASSGSLESWESADSFHWSGEDVYMPPLVGEPTAESSSTAHGAAQSSAHGGAEVMGAGDEPRPKPGFYPRFPRKLRQGDPIPFMSSDDLNASYSQFSEFHRDASRRSLDSFKDPGSALGSGSRSTFMSRSGFVSGEGSGSSNSAMGRFASSNLTYSSVEEPAIVSTAQRRSVEAQRLSVHGEVIDFTQPAPVPAPAEHLYPIGSRVLAGPVMPTTLRPPRRRGSSSRKTSAHVSATRDHIVGTSPVPDAEQLDSYYYDGAATERGHRSRDVLYTAPLDREDDVFR